MNWGQAGVAGRKIVVLAVIVIASLPQTATATTSRAERRFAPVNRPGPPLTVPEGKLRRAFSCSSNLGQTPHQPVLLVPGTTVTPEEHFGWNYMPAFDHVGRPYCAITTPKHAMEDMQISAEYVVYAIRNMYRRAGRKIAILGGSQGGSLPRWALRFWPDTRHMVEDHIGLAPTNHGGKNNSYLCIPDCAPALWQQQWRSRFMLAMNSAQETFAGISYTEVFSENDEIVTPPAAASSLHGGGGRITNVALQDICPGHFAGHVKAASYDAVGYALAIYALTHDGPADPRRIDTQVCGEEPMPGVDPVTHSTGNATASAAIIYQLATAERTRKEPRLRCYVFATEC